MTEFVAEAISKLLTGCTPLEAIMILAPAALWVFRNLLSPNIR